MSQQRRGPPSTTPPPGQPPTDPLRSGAGRPMGHSVPTLGPSTMQTPAGTVGPADTSPQQPGAGGVPGYSQGMPYGGAPYPTSYPGAGYSPEAYNAPFQPPGRPGGPGASPGYGGMTQSV